jgi:hypothetical protein
MAVFVIEERGQPSRSLLPGRPFPLVRV